MKVLKQKVVRTTIITFDGTEELKKLLAEGYTVVMCNKLDENTLEYIVQKEEEEEKEEWNF